MKKQNKWEQRSPLRAADVIVTCGDPKMPLLSSLSRTWGRPLLLPFLEALSRVCVWEGGKYTDGCDMVSSNQGRTELVRTGSAPTAFTHRRYGNCWPSSLSHDAEATWWKHLFFFHWVSGDLPFPEWEAASHLLTTQIHITTAPGLSLPHLFCLPISTPDISCLTNCSWCDVFTISP